MISITIFIPYYVNLYGAYKLLPLYNPTASIQMCFMLMVCQFGQSSSDSIMLCL